MTTTSFAGTVLSIVVGLFVFGLAMYSVSSRKRKDAASSVRTTGGAKHVLYGATLIHDGCPYYPDWRTSMLREFDDSIESNLKQVFEMSKSIAAHPRTEWATLVAQGLKKDLGGEDL